MCCPNTRPSSVKNLLVFVVKDTPVHTTITAKTGGGAHTNTNTGALLYHLWLLFYCSHILTEQFHCFHRALPCPAVKQSEEWGDPSKCEGAEGCQYCHTRTEQQFHPEVCMLFRGLTSCWRGQRNRLQCVLGGSRRQGPWRADPRLQKLATGTWNVTFLKGKMAD